MCEQKDRKMIEYVYVSMNNDIFFFDLTVTPSWMKIRAKIQFEWWIECIHRIYLFWWCTVLWRLSLTLFVECEIEIQLRSSSAHTEKTATKRHTQNSSHWPNLQFPAVDKKCITGIRSKQNTHVFNILSYILWCKSSFHIDANVKFNPLVVSVCMSVFIYLIWLHVYSVFVIFQVNNWRHIVGPLNNIAVLNFMMAKMWSFLHSMPAIKSNKNGWMLNVPVVSSWHAFFPLLVVYLLDVHSDTNFSGQFVLFGQFG